MKYKHISFVGLCLGFFIVMMDMTTVPLMYTTLMDEFTVSPARVAWVNNIYLITYAASLLLGGRLGDSTDRKIVLIGALLVLGLGAAISGAGQTFVEVIVGRALMGIGAGFLTSQSMAYISILFAKGGRGTALGVWGAVAGIATATGPVITQLLLTTADWRWVMWINIPFVLAALVIALRCLPSDPGSGIRLSETFASAVYGLCLAGVIIGIHYISVAGILRGVGIALILIGAAVIAILIRKEVKNKSAYILSPELWFDGTFFRICFISGLLGLGVASFYLPLAFLLDVCMNFGPVAISVLMMTIALSNAVVGPYAGHLSDRIKPEGIVRSGLMLFALANGLLGFIGVLMPGGTVTFIALFLVMMIGGAGTGLAFAPLANLALSRVSFEALGRAAAFFNSIRQALSAMGAVIVAILFDWIVRLKLGIDLEITATNLRESPGITGLATLVCFLLIALGLSIAAYLSRSSRQDSVQGEVLNT
ncbi:MFS transporter [Microbulbifer sp. SSSA007]|uniref:MFS transporter n=1 Tax=Microbulbifer sp. SSSA007 TaxID=3243379 RepID=UPI00403A7071